MLTSWGGLAARGFERQSENLEPITSGAALSRGLGRSYGDSSLPASDRDGVAGTVLADRILSFDDSSGVIRAEAGLSLSDLNRILLLR
jgi:decaprenylphospho-beta-D-ribofuranose 2-oxidase